jgi:hypothetical protein
VSPTLPERGNRVEIALFEPISPLKIVAGPHEIKERPEPVATPAGAEAKKPG